MSHVGSPTRHLRAYDYDVAVLEWRMPERTGIEVVGEARSRDDRTPILMLTARDAPSDRVAGLNGGVALAAVPVLECADLRFDPATREVSVSGDLIALTAIEFSLVELMLRRAPSLLTRRMIATQVWDDEPDAVGSSTLDVHVARLRVKLGASRARIETVRGLGYRMVGT